MKFRQSSNLQTVETKTMLLRDGKCKGKCCKGNLKQIAASVSKLPVQLDYCSYGFSNMPSVKMWLALRKQSAPFLEVTRA